MLFRSLVACAALLVGAQASVAAEPVSFLMSWKAQAEQGGYYDALANGYYKDCGVDLTLRQGGPGIDSVQLLVGGAVDLALVPQMDGVLHMNEAGFPGRAIMTSFQRTPQILMAHEGSGVNAMEDIRGKPVLIAASGRNTYWPFLKQKFGYTDAQVRSYTGQLAPWIANPQAIQQGLVTNEPFLVKKQTGETPKVFLLADYGYGTYGSLVATSQTLIDKKPQAVACVVSASIKGWTHYLKDPAVAFAAIKKADPNNADDLMAYSYETMKSRHLVETDETATIGVNAMTDARWKAHAEMLVSLGLLGKAVDYKQAFTLQFLQKAKQKP